MAIKHPDVAAHPEKYPEATRTVLLFDLHFPTHDKRFWKVTLKWLKTRQPARIVLGGDCVDAEAVSRHGGNPSPPLLQKELRVPKACLRQLRDACPTAEIVYLEGSHETRLLRYLIENAPALFGLLSMPELLELEELGIQWVPETKQPIRIGPAKILHGHQLEGGGGIYPARKLVDLYGEPGVTVICGHFHRWQVFVKNMHPKPSTGMVIPCGRTKQPRWRLGPTGWQNGIALIEGNKVVVLDANDGVICDGGQVFRA